LVPESTVVPEPIWAMFTAPVIVPKVFEPCVIVLERLKASVPAGEPVIVLAVLITPVAPPLPSCSVPASIWVRPV
jgi:hypothetical protein